MIVLNLVYTFLIGSTSQSVLYKFSESIDYQYSKKYHLISNIITGLFYCCFWVLYGYSSQFFIYSLCSTILVSISIIDSFYLEIPDEHNLLIFLLGITYAILNPQTITNAVLGGLYGGGIYLLMAIISKGGIGGGDIKLAAVTGILLGPRNTVLGVYYTFIIATVGLVHSVYKALVNKKKTRKFEMESEMAFGPYIVTTVLMILLRLA